IPGAPGYQANQAILARYGNGGPGYPEVVLVRLPPGVSPSGPAGRAALGRAFTAVARELGLRVADYASTGDRAFLGDDGHTSYGLVFTPYTGELSPPSLGPEITAAMRPRLPDGSQVAVTGLNELVNGGQAKEGFGILAEILLAGTAALAVLFFVFGSALALLPVLMAAVTLPASFLALYGLTELTPVSVVVQYLTALIGLGVAIDYSLLFVTRWREERDHGRENHDAVVVAMQTAGHAVVFSGVTVAIGLLALIVLPVPFMRSMGIGGALIPVASVLVTLTLTPAILGGIGPRVDWPKIRHENRASRGWSRWAAGVVKHRWLAAISGLAVLFALIGVFFTAKIGVASSDSLAHNGKAYDTLQVLKRGGMPTGALTPMEVLVSTDQARAAADRLRQINGIEAAFVPSGPAGNRDGQSIVVLVPEKETVNSKSVAVVKQVKRVANHLPGVVGVAGLGPAQIDFMRAVYGNFPLMLTIIALLTYVLLMRAFRSTLLPLKAVILNILSVGATLGLMVLFWQYGFGSQAIFGIHSTGAITFWIPLMVFAFLYGLSMDYEVFILSRIREEYDGARSTNAAVIEGMGRTGRLVTSAALILFLAFAALASGPGTDLKTLATGLGFGILLDAILVRSLLVPSLVSLFGRWNWYLPSRVARVLRVQPSHPHPERPEPREPERAAVG
ncbi:MAG TPA: MMPL family transporter, partial [Jatrophihabitantaceae bacterium]|nr:MMPL family transporter [Jatrophihabitantaceae bacterium]